MTFYKDNIACEEVKSETVKSILENMDSILKELGTELRQINDAIYSPSNVVDDTRSEPQDNCLLCTLSRQRDLAESLLKLTMHIRDGLW